MSFRKIISQNPYSNQIIKEFPFISNTELLRKIDQSHEAYLHNRRLSIPQRTDKLVKLANLLESNAERYGQIITTEMGKPITSAIAEVKKCAIHCRYFAEHAEKYLRATRVKTEARKSLIEYEPMGLIYHIIPFNFPI